MKKKRIALVITFAIVAIPVFLFAYYFGIVNSVVGQLYLKLFNVPGKHIATVTAVAISENSPYLVYGEGPAYSQDYSLTLLNTSTDKKTPIDSGVGKITPQIFSPRGDKFLYPVIRKSDVFVSDTDNTFYYFYDLYIYDIASGIKTRITDESRSYLLNTYDDPWYGWIDDSHIAYICEKELVYSSAKGCLYDLKTGQTTPVNPLPTLHITNINSPNIPVGSDFVNCFYNFDQTKCAYGKLRFHIWDGVLFQEIWVRNGSSEKVIYRDRGRINSLYWTKDDHLYGIFWNTLMQLI